MPPLGRATEWANVRWIWATAEALPPRAERDAAVGGFLLVRAALPGPDQRQDLLRPGCRAVLDGQGSRPGRTTPAASTCTSAASSTPCCTCCTPGSGTRRCTTWATSPARSRTAGCSTRATSRPTPTPTSAASTCPPTRSSRSAPGVFEFEGRPVTQEYGKMGKSLNNVVTPDDMCERYGADTFRLYEMGMGPMDMSRPWQTRAWSASLRYLQRLWRLVIDEAHRRDRRRRRREPDEETPKTVAPHHRRGRPPTTCEMAYNTAIAKLIVLTNHLTKSGGAGPAVGGRGPGADDGSAGAAHQRGDVAAAGSLGVVGARAFPGRRPGAAGGRAVRVPDPGQGQGPGPDHRRRRCRRPTDVQAAALAEPRIVELLAGATPRKVVVVPGRMVSIVV